MLHNPLGFGAALTGLFSVTKIGASLKEKIVLAGLATAAACYLFPAFFSLKSAVVGMGKTAVGYYKTYVSGPWGDILNPIIQHESGGISNALHGHTTFPPGSSIAEVAATGKASGLVQTIPNTLKSLATKMHIPFSTPYTPDIQIQMGKKLLIDAGVLNPAIPSQTVADKIADIFCVAAKSNGLPAAACGNKTAPISFVESVRNVMGFRQQVFANPALAQ